MELQTTALTELEAVNNIIGTIGESPIDTLEDMTDVDSINALRILRDINRQEQARGWSFNLTPLYTLYPNENKKISWNSDFIYIKAKDPHIKLIRQGEYVKNLFTNTTTFEYPIQAEVVFYVPFEELPEQMRSYILAKACYLFQERYFGDDALTKITQQQVQEAWQHLQEFEIDNNNYTMLHNTYVRHLRMR